MYQPKNTHNWGSLCRTAQILKVSYLASIGRRFPKQASDTQKSWRHVPVFEFGTFTDFKNHLPFGCRLVAVEMLATAKPIATFRHPQQVCYLLGAEDRGLPDSVLEQCDHAIVLPGDSCLNVSVAGSIVLYDRFVKTL